MLINNIACVCDRIEIFYEEMHCVCVLPSQLLCAIQIRAKSRQKESENYIAYCNNEETGSHLFYVKITLVLE